jgi:hypothetical protein
MKIEIEEEKNKVVQLTKTNEELKQYPYSHASFKMLRITLKRTMAAEQQKMEEEKQTLAQEKGDIDNEMMRLVEQRLEMQQTKQIMEYKESHLLLSIKEKDVKLEELTNLLAEERKQVGRT